MYMYACMCGVLRPTRSHAEEDANSASTECGANAIELLHEAARCGALVSGQQSYERRQRRRGRGTRGRRGSSSRSRWANTQQPMNTKHGGQQRGLRGLSEGNHVRHGAAGSTCLVSLTARTTALASPLSSLRRVLPQHATGDESTEKRPTSHVPRSSHA